MGYSTKQAEDRLKRSINHRLKEILNTERDNPVLKAQHSWSIVSEQLRFILGEEVHRQWFQKTKPLVLNNKILILQTHSTFAAQWINTHYQELVENLLKSQDRNLSCFFIAPKKVTRKSHFGSK
ncbi:MAG: hypothetical protein CMJ16_02735 [Peredibacter sp.]|nr:hypothetical protein [Peredibacter sp.]|tara:strand:- start:1284 stop:1655 length:372 start_codon:yes stop_codon:yes gene_type:complete